MTIALVVAGLMGFAGCSKSKPAATTPDKTENTGGDMGSGSATGGSTYGGATEPGMGGNPCGGGGEMANPCGGE
ncbi:MAG: hypothetical protein K8W52_36165 [Deltaproteobacteria bacterium]|nr:hypothetical protein [Deltaproteobacteria bacterium]